MGNIPDSLLKVIGECDGEAECESDVAPSRRQTTGGRGPVWLLRGSH